MSLDGLAAVSVTERGGLKFKLFVCAFVFFQQDLESSSRQLLER